MASFGIDFGTTNSVLASATGSSISTVSLDEPPVEWAALGFDKVLPSVVATDGADGWTYGWAAKAQSEGSLAAVKRLLADPDEVVSIGKETLPVEQVAASLFQEIKRKASDSGLTLDHAVVTIPANSRGAARLRTRIAAGLAGIEVAALINEPTAAAMAFGRGIKHEERVLVFDFGGGTLDVTILQNLEGVFMEQASKGVAKLGGIDIDAALAAAVKARIPNLEGWDETTDKEFLLDIEMAKIKLSTQPKTTVPVPGGDVVEVAREELVVVLQPLLQRASGAIKTCLNDLGGDVKIDHLALVGGSSKIPAVRDFVSRLVGIRPMEDVNPMTAIAKGAALAASILNEETTDLDFFVSTEHALGTIIFNPETEVSSFSVLIGRNQMLPAEKTDFYQPAYDYAEQLNIRVIEGDPELPLDHDDNVILREWMIDLAEPKPSAEAGIAITYEYNVDGILHVLVRELASDVVLMDEQLSFGAAKQDVVAMKQSLNRMISGDDVRTEAQPAPVSSGLDPESQALVDKVSEKIIPFVDEEEQGRLQAIIAELAESSDEDLGEAKRRLGAAMREHAYLL